MQQNQIIVEQSIEETSKDCQSQLQEQIDSDVETDRFFKQLEQKIQTS
jgi:hypothetical protein